MKIKKKLTPDKQLDKKTKNNMTRVHDFVCDLSKAGKSIREIMEIVEAAYPGKGLSLSQVYRLIKAVKEGKETKDMRGKDETKTIRTPHFIESVKADVEANRRTSVHQLAEWHAVSVGTIYNVLHGDLGLSKKSARWVPKLLSDEQKRVRIQCSRAFVDRYEREGDAFLDKIITMDESAVAYHTPETKEQSKQWVKRGSPGPIKCKSQESRVKQMVLAFHDREGLIYTNMVPRGSTVNAVYIVGALKKFLKRMRQKRSEKMKDGIILHWDNAPVHTARIVREYLATRDDIEVMDHPPYSPDLAPCDFFLFPKLKNKLAGDFLSAESFKTRWSGVASTLSTEDYTMAFQKWLERHQKCIRVDGYYVEKC